MCLMMPARIIAVDGVNADIDIAGTRRRASMLPVPDAQAGDWAIVAAGSLIRLIDSQTAHQIAAAVRLASIEPRGDRR